MSTKFSAPKVIVTPSMLKAGMDFMAKCLKDEEVSDKALTDEQMIIGTFLAMWQAYWTEINDTHKRHQAGSPIIKPVNLILPH